MTGRLWTFETCQVILKELLKQPRPYGSANRKQGSPRGALDTGTTWTWEKCLGFPKFVPGFSTKMFVFFWVVINVMSHELPHFLQLDLFT